MPWPRDEPDPLRAQRLALERREKELTARRQQLAEELRNGPVVVKKVAEPPVWRLEEEASSSPARGPELSGPRRRNLARQRRRDKILFFLLMGVLVVVSLIVLWVYKTHLAATN